MGRSHVQDHDSTRTLYTSWTQRALYTPAIVAGSGRKLTRPTGSETKTLAPTDLNCAAPTQHVQLTLGRSGTENDLIIYTLRQHPPAHGTAPSGSSCNVHRKACDLIESTSSTATHTCVLWLTCLEPFDRLLLNRTPNCARCRCQAHSIAACRWKLSCCVCPPHLVHLNSEFDCVGRCLGAQVVHARLQTQLPTMEVHGGEFGNCGIDHMDVKRLGLVNVCTACSRHSEHNPLLDLPDRFIKILQVHGKVQVLHATIARDELHTHVVSPEAVMNQITEQVSVHLNKLAREHARRGFGYRAQMIRCSQGSVLC